MKLNCTELTRGSGKIYIRVDVDGTSEVVPSPLYVLSARAKTARKQELPSCVLPLEGGTSFVVVLAVLDVRQKLKLRLMDGQGALLAKLSRTVDPAVARLTSQFNTLRRNRAALAIRNFDADERHVGVRVEVRDVIYHADDGCDIVHGTVELRGFTQEEVAGEVQLALFDQHGILQDGGAWTPMGDSVTADPAAEGVLLRCVGFSAKITRGLGSLAVWAHTDEGPDTHLGARPGAQTSHIRCLQSHELAERCGWWDELSQSAQVSPRYDAWFRLCHRTPAYVLDRQRERRFEHEPLFSIVVPLFRTPLDFFEEMCASVLAQTYAKLELVLVNASPEDTGLAQACKDLCARDERVRLVTLEGNRGIVGNTYAGVDAATGEFVSFFDHDDVLEPDLLWRYMEGIEAHPDTDLLYCDEDKLQDGVYLSPYFKPDFSPDLLRSNNYLCHLLTVRKTIVNELPREGLERYEGSQDHHLALFASERARNVFHARRVLYHWRMHAASTAANIGSKSYTEEAGVRAVQAHLDRLGIPGTARPSGVAPNTYHVDYEVAGEPLVSVIIPNKDMPEVLARCVRSVLDVSTYTNLEVVIVENNSTQGETFALYEKLAAEDERVRVVRQPSDGTFNFSRTINFGAAHATGAFLLMLNNDTEVLSANWIERMLGHAQRSEVGCVGAKLLYPDGLVQHAGVMLHKGTGPFHVAAYLPANTLHHYCSVQLTGNYSAVTGACLLVRRSVFDEVGGLDEELAVDYNDVDFCLRVRASGRTVVYEPEACLMHYESISRGSHRTLAQREAWCAHSGLMMERWSRYYAEGDPYANPNLAFNAYHHLEG